MLARVMLLPEAVVPLTRPRCEWSEMRPGSTVLPVSLMMIVLGGGLMALGVTGWESRWLPGWVSCWAALGPLGRVSCAPVSWLPFGPAGWSSGSTLIAVVFDPVMRMSAC